MRITRDFPGDDLFVPEVRFYDAAGQPLESAGEHAQRLDDKTLVQEVAESRDHPFQTAWDSVLAKELEHRLNKKL